MAVEIEVKAKVRDKAVLLKNLSEIGCTLDEIKSQVDTVFTQHVGSLETFLSNDVFLRIRIQDGTKVVLTAKKPKNKSGNSLIKQEHEVTVDSADEARGLLSLMGFQEVVTVNKLRQSGHYKNYEICVDDIEDLGTFIEVEVLGNAENAEALQQDLWQFLATLNVLPEDRVTRGYDILMIEKKQK